MNKSENAIVLLSGGLDSLAALGYTQKRCEIKISAAITFDYGQKAAINEISTSKAICDFYGIKHHLITLDWLKTITKTALVSEKTVPNRNFQTSESAKSVWVPNRNALFLNIAACFCDSYNFKYIIIGANDEEGQTFPDNTEAFCKQTTELFKYSTMSKPEVFAPLINCSKNDIVKIAVEDSVPLELVWSCYRSGKKHCGMCESCNNLKNALIANHCSKYLDILFEENEN